ncbi:DUF1353 domain-containing protein [bacterium]|nr:DUF1353 domain-containing protein [bacterium]
MSEVALPFLPKSYAQVPPPLPSAEVAYITQIGKWRLLRAYTFPLPTGEFVTVPCGYEYDGASIPKRLWDRIGPHELSMEAPLLHDWLYDHLGKVVPGLGRIVSREEADGFFHAVMERQRVPDAYRVLAFTAVRGFGGLTTRVFNALQKLRALNAGCRIGPTLGAMAIGMGRGQIVVMVLQLVWEILKRRAARQQSESLALAMPKSRNASLGERLWAWVSKKPETVSVPAPKQSPKQRSLSSEEDWLAQFKADWKRRERHELANGDNAAAGFRWDKWGKKWECGYGVTPDEVTDARRLGIDIRWVNGWDEEKDLPIFVDKEQADRWFDRVTLPTYLRMVELIVAVSLNDRQKHALACFAHNTGAGALRKAVSGAERLNSGNYDSVRAVLPLYVKAGGKTLPGLVTRRQAEVELFYS